MTEAGGEQGTYRVAEDIPQRYYDIEHTRMTLEAGWLGKIIGSATNAPTNIAGFTWLFRSLITACIHAASRQMSHESAYHSKGFEVRKRQ
jgi:hypothetical protein